MRVAELRSFAAKFNLTVKILAVAANSLRKQNSVLKTKSGR